jgi:hypothetical protein
MWPWPYTRKTQGGKPLKGKHVLRPINPKALPIVADEAVQRDFGTGVLKITPAHDKLDFEIAKRHDLPMIEILNADGTLNEHAGPNYQGMERFAARRIVVKNLDEEGMLIESEPYENNVGLFGESRMYRSSRDYPSNGSSNTQESRRPSRQCVMVIFPFSPNAGKRLICTGWIIFRTGVSAVSCGGGIVSLFGIARVEYVRIRPIGMWATSPPRIYITGNRTKMYWTPGHLRGFGPWLP